MADASGQPMNYDDAMSLRRELTDEEHRFIRETSAKLSKLQRRIYDAMLTHEVMHPTMIYHRAGVSKDQGQTPLTALRKAGLIWAVKCDATPKHPRAHHKYVKTRTRLVCPQVELRKPRKGKTNQHQQKAPPAASTNGNGSSGARQFQHDITIGGLVKVGEKLAVKRHRTPHEEVTYQLYKLYIHYTEGAKCYQAMFEALQQFGSQAKAVEDMGTYMMRQMQAMGIQTRA